MAVLRHKSSPHFRFQAGRLGNVPAQQGLAADLVDVLSPRPATASERERELRHGNANRRRDDQELVVAGLIVGPRRKPWFAGWGVRFHEWSSLNFHLR